MFATHCTSHKLSWSQFLLLLNGFGIMCITYVCKSASWPLAHSAPGTLTSLLFLKTCQAPPPWGLWKGSSHFLEYSFPNIRRDSCFSSFKLGLEFPQAHVPSPRTTSKAGSQCPHFSYRKLALPPFKTQTVQNSFKQTKYSTLSFKTLKNL